jgi:hypothetical protein
MMEQWKKVLTALADMSSVNSPAVQGRETGYKVEWMNG